ncbi:MAG: putative DNA binding domain-containing protein [Aliarcobacter sp.]|nr:putative DNA binding domain-containing protein [Aliarcobacter sp.]
MTIEEILELKENFEVELKKATGKDGKGELPIDFWKTYSAMANSYGGTVFLGIKEKQDKSIEILGIENIEKVKKTLFDTLNNPKKVNKNLLTDKNVIEIEIDEKRILKIVIPRAKREDKPIYIDDNIFEGTFKRNFEGDYHCDKETIKRMISEQVEDSRDNRILKGFDFSDIDIDTLNTYRNMLSAHKPEHPYNEYDPKEFLRVIGGYGKNRDTNEEGLTIAGLLMFGKLHTIREEIPNYMIDYQERPEAKTEHRWIDRITTDGTWSGNLFDFYRKVIKKLYSDLKVPFSLDGNVRQDNTLIHIALREALINTISHADYSGRISLLIVKRPDMFGFRNPGLMRIPIESAISGGESDCRNRTIHQMFLLIGLGERAGSGLPKIFSGWTSQHWSKPLLYEKQEPEQTLLELRMIDLFDDSVINNLIEIYGDRFKKLDNTKRVILATAYLEKVVNHSRLNGIIDEHAHDISNILKQLVEDKFLNSDGIGRGKVYFLPTRNFNIPNDFTFEGSDISTQAPDISTQAPDISPDIVSNLEMLKFDEKKMLEEISYEISVTPRIKDKGELQRVILEICSNKYISLTILSQLLNRSSDSLRKHYLNPMVKNGILVRAYETKPNHPNQAYKIPNK